MGSVTLSNLNDRFAEGASLSIYPASNFSSAKPAVPGQAPIGSAVGSAQAVSSGAVAFPGLTDETDYVVTDGSGSKYLRVSTRKASQLERQANKDQPGGYAAYTELVVSGGTADDTATVQAALTAARVAGVGTVRGVPGTTYKISGPLVIGSGTKLDMTGCTIQFTSTSIKTNMLQNYVVTPAATATDASTSVGSSVVTSATLAAVAQVGQNLAVVGAGPPGGDGGGAIWLYGTVASISGNNITLSGNTNGVAAQAAVSGATAYLFNRDKNIQIIGGRWDAGTNWNVFADRQTFNSHQLRLRRVDGLTVRGVTVALSGFGAGGGWAFGVNPGDCADFLIEDITADSSSTAVQGDGPLHRGIVRNIRGKTMDDMVAFGPVGFQGNDVEGDITDLQIDGIESNGSWTGFKFFGGLGSNSAQRLLQGSVRSVKGSTTNSPITMVDYTTAGPMTLDVDDITATPGSGKDAISNTSSLGVIQRPAREVFRSGDSGLKLATFDPMDAVGTFQVGGGFIYLTQVKVPHTITVANLILIVSTAGSGLTANQCFAGIYDSNGNLWAATADQSGQWNSAGSKVMPLSAQGGRSLTLPGGPGVFYWVAVLANGTTKPIFTAKTSSLVPNLGFAGTYSATPPSAKHRIGYESVGGRTALVSLSGLTITDSNFRSMIWFGVT